VKAPQRKSTRDRKDDMISLTAEYALRAVVWMARRPDLAVGTRDIAEATQVPVGYMSKVLQALGRANLVCSRPGRTGGFVLGRDPAAISVLDIVQAVDPIHRIDRCPLNRRQHDGRLCPLHRRLDQAVAMVERAFAESTLAELVAETADDEALCTTQMPPNTTPVQIDKRRKAKGRPARAPARQEPAIRSPKRTRAD
jgi:Rrf2 family nitric oxide-sensitive transcriptional repressor